MNNRYRTLGYRATLTLACALVLTACGGGGGGGGDDAPASPAGPQPRAFTVTLQDIDVRRSQNGEPITVDTSGVTSGTLTVQ